jgi:hypothetical protein
MTDNFTSIRMKKIFNLAVLLCGLAALPVQAQLAVPPPTPVYQPLSYQQLDQLLGPIALYPDPLIAQILPASTLPTQIVLADRYVTGGGDPNQIDQQPWDASVQALARYPNVLKWMDDNLNWTTELGQAFLNQQQDVMDSIQRLRASASNLGNLQSTPQEQVVNDGGYIEILPTEPQVIYVPVYQPDEVYYQSGFGITFGIGFPIGIWLNCDFDWHHHHLIVWPHDHPRPANWWHERPEQRAVLIERQTAVWRPEGQHYPAVVNRGDRGWNNPVVRSTAPVVNRPEQHATPPREVPSHDVQPHNVTTVNTPRAELVPAQHPAPVQRSAPVSRPVSNSVFVGIQSSRETKTFSNRGQQSMQTITHSEPVHSAPVSHPAPSSSGGGGGSHGSGSQPKR